MAIKISKIKITYEPLNGKYKPSLDSEAIHKLIYTDPKKAKLILEDYLKKDPYNPVATNWLIGALQMLGKHEQAQDLAEDNYERHPDYIFNMLTLARYDLLDGWYNDVKFLFNDTWDIASRYPEREEFHISEVLAFYQLVHDYFEAIGEDDVAASYANMLKQLQPRHD